MKIGTFSGGFATNNFVNLAGFQLSGGMAGTGSGLPHYCAAQQHSTAVTVSLATALAVIFIAAVLINVSIILVFARKRSLRTTSNRYLYFY